MKKKDNKDNDDDNGIPHCNNDDDEAGNGKSNKNSGYENDHINKKKNRQFINDI